MASRRTESTARSRSVRGVFRNLSRAGVAKNRSRTSIRVPGGCAAGAGTDLLPASTTISQALSASRGRDTTRMRLTAPIDGRASPRNPSAAIRNKLSSGSFDVQWRSTARASSSGVMPAPLSATAISAWPPSRNVTSMREAPASIAFSTNSLTAAAGRSMTSPAAMRLTRTGGRRRIAIARVYANGERDNRKERGMPSRTADDAGAEYLERARAFVPELAAAAPEIERQRELPEPVVAAMVEHGFFRMLLPRSLGGAELLPVPYVPVVEEIAKGDASAAWCLNQGAGCSMTAAYLDPVAAREVFGGPRGILAWGPGPGKARIVEGGYRVTATWSFASGSHNATWLGCHVPIYDENGKQQLQPDGSPVIRTPIFPKSCA